MSCFQFHTFYPFFYGLLNHIKEFFKELFYLIEEDIQSSIIYFEIKFEANQHRFVFSNEIFQCRIHIVLDKEDLRKSRLK